MDGGKGITSLEMQLQLCPIIVVLEVNCYLGHVNKRSK